MRLSKLTILILILTLPSCRKNQCDFNSYIQKIEIIDSSFTFRSFGKLEVHPESNRICDSAFFGKDLRAIGVIKKDKELYSVLLHSYNKMFLETLDQNGHIMDKIELVRNNGVVNDSTSILSTYILQKDNSFCRVDTMEFKGFEPDKNQYSVMLVRIDTVKYVGGKIVIK